MKQSYKIYLLFTVLAFLLYGNTIWNDYALDDDFVISGPDNIVQKGIKAIPKILSSYHVTDESGNTYEYRPIIKISYAIETQIFSNNVHTHHFFNILFYALCLIVLFKMLILLFKNKVSYHLIIFIVILFAFVPTHSEVVASLKNRDVMLSFIFSMLTLINFLKYFSSNQNKFIVYAFLMFFLALLSKFDSLPVAAITVLIYMQNKGVSKKSIKTIGLILITFVTAYFLVQKGKFLFLDKSLQIRNFNYFESPLYFHKDLLYRLYGLFNSLGFYVLILFAPLKMACYYGYDTIPVDTFFSLESIVGIVVFVALAYLFFKRFKTQDLLWWGVVFFFVTLSMFLNFVKPAPGIVADRFLFFPSLGWAMILSYFIEQLNLYLQKKDIHKIDWLKINWMKSKIKPYLLIYLGLCLIVVFKRNLEWKNKITLYETDLKKYPNSVKLHILYGSQVIIELLSKSNAIPQQQMPQYLQKALASFYDGLKTDSTCSSCYNNIAYILMNWKQDYAGSIPFLLKSYRLDTTRKEMLANIAVSYYKSNRNIDTAILFAKKSIRADRDRNFEIPHSVLFEIYKDHNRYKEGIAFFNTAIEQRPRSEYLHFCMAQLYLLDGDTANSIKSYETLLNINSNYPQVVSLLNTLKKNYKPK